MHGEPREFSEAQIAKYKERFSLFTLEATRPKAGAAATNGPVVVLAGAASGCRPE